MSAPSLRAGLWGALALLLAGCGGTVTSAPPVIDIALIGFNDFHGNLVSRHTPNVG